jgi:tetratricopeptide (TPR) repeat protein
MGYTNLGLALHMQQKCSEAHPLLLKALDLRRELLSDEHPETITAYENVARNLLEMREFAAAELLFQKVLDARLALYGERHRATTTSYSNLAASLIKQDKHADAEKLVRKALELNVELLGERHPDTILNHNNLATCLLSQGKYRDSQALFAEMMESYRLQFGENHLSTASAYSNYAVNLYGQKLYSQAVPILESAVASYEGARLAVAGRGSDRAVFGEARSPYCLLATAHAQLESYKAAWEAAEADLARGLFDEVAALRGVALPDEERQRQTSMNAELQSIHARLRPLVAKSAPTVAEADEVALLRAQRHELESKISTLAIAASQRELATPEQIQTSLPANAALVFWIDTHDHWGCVVRRSDGPHWVRLAGGGNGGEWTQRDRDLPSQFRAAVASTSMSAKEIQALGKQLYAQRLLPLEQHLDGVERLYVVPVNEMSGIPCETLTAEFTVSYVPSGTFLARLPDRKPPAGDAILALGDPIFAPSTAQSKPSEPGTEPPPGGE